MASPPYRSPAASPPYPASSVLPNSRKRPLPHSTTTAPAAPYPKKRKPSSFSTTASGALSAHPLRQTSFPPEGTVAASSVARSPSVDSDRTGATGARSAAGAGARRRGRGGRRKDDGASVRSGKGADGRSRVGPPGEGEDGEAEEDEEEGAEGEEGAEVLRELEGTTKVDKAAEKKRMTLLIDSFNPDQSDRYDVFRRVKLKKDALRRIVNQTLSQSVPPSVITTINGYTKVFLGTLIERARDVRLQDALTAQRSLPTPPPRPGSPGTSAFLTQPSTSSSIADRPEGVRETSPPALAVEKNPTADPEKMYLGPIMPDHLREAFRRYRRDGEGGGAGVGGFSVGLGMPGAGTAKTGGKRLFR